MTWWHAVVEAEHELQNPTSADKIRLLGERLGLGSGSHVVDLARAAAGRPSSSPRRSAAG